MILTALANRHEKTIASPVANGSGFLLLIVQANRISNSVAVIK